MMRDMDAKETRVCDRCGVTQNRDQFAEHGKVCHSCKISARDRIRVHVTPEEWAAVQHMRNMKRLKGVSCE